MKIMSNTFNMAIAIANHLDALNIKAGGIARNGVAAHVNALGVKKLSLT